LPRAATVPPGGYNQDRLPEILRDRLTINKEKGNVMKKFGGVTLGLACAASLLMSQAVTADPKTTTITITLDPHTGVPESVSPDPVHANAGDELRWHIPGAPGKDFTLEFPEGSPCDDEIRRGTNVICTIKSDAETKDYKYDVVDDEGRLDPIIIVDPN
jgi:hypothetical protein